MAQIREIKKSIKAVDTIQRITKTMQMIATVKFTSSMQRAHAAKPYTETIEHMVGQVAAAAGDIEHPLIDGPREKQNRELLVVISSDRGFCGAFNANVLRTSRRHLRELGSNGVACDLHTSGKKAVAFFKFERFDIAERHMLGDAPKYDDVERLAQTFIDEFMAGKYDAIRVAYMKFIRTSRQTPELLQLLPLKPEASEADEKTGGVGALYDFSPSSDKLLGELLPLTVKTALYQSFLDAAVSEQIMRMVAMKAATDNAAELARLRRRQYNRARQAKITTELMEVISGAAALD